jgi:hypothetical protein
VYVQMYWLLIKKEYIIVFLYIISAITNHAVWITASERIAHKQSDAGTMFAKPGPKGVVINLVYSNHV